MSDARPGAAPQHPRTVRLDDHTALGLRLMTAADAAPIVAFARSLPDDDLLFLRTDITNPDMVAEWVQNLEAGRTIAEVDGEMAGYAALVTNRLSWQRHLGEIRIQVAQRYRSRGVGRALAGEILALARPRGLRKIVAQMTPDQKGAIATFERLGFRPEASLPCADLPAPGRTSPR
ncbi:MAG TPA: GNAT family N-acetyltransferase [Candidatus Binatia bacterium]|nr:GNAT family N-acetyltransferase [Candidatus Binatia bacterium]